MVGYKKRIASLEEEIVDLKRSISKLYERCNNIANYNELLEQRISKLTEEVSTQKQKVEQEKSYEQIIGEWLNGSTAMEGNEE